MLFIPFPAKSPREIAAGIPFFGGGGLAVLLLKLEFIFLVTSGLECLTKTKFQEAEMR